MKPTLAIALLTSLFLTCARPSAALIPRQSLISHFNPHRTSSVPTSSVPTSTSNPNPNQLTPTPNHPTPMQIGNGNFAFGADLTSLQTFLPFASLSSWGWKADALPPGVSAADVEAYRGAEWWNHGRLVEYDFGGANAQVEQWLISNPNRVNLGRVGLLFLDADGAVMQDVQESDLEGAEQELDLWTGEMRSRFRFEGEEVEVRVGCAQEADSVGVEIKSELVGRGRLGVFVDFPWGDGTAKFSAPFVGDWGVPERHTTNLTIPHSGGTRSTRPGPGSVQAEITHTMDGTAFYTALAGDALTVERQSPAAHRYSVLPASPQLHSSSSTFALSITFANTSTLHLHPTTPNSTTLSGTVPSPSEISSSSRRAWAAYWTQSGFIDVLTGSRDAHRAAELQRRIVLSRYLMRVNEAGDTPPQESGLVNDGWKIPHGWVWPSFHGTNDLQWFSEMYFWHSAHWALWSNWDLLGRSSDIYSRFLNSSIQRAQVQQGWPAGARWPKMTDPSGRSSPGEINNLLIWEQPHPLIFAQYEYRAFPTLATLEKWEDVVRQTADWMAAFAWWNATRGAYDLGPPMYVVSEDTGPNVTRNAAFELAYWRFGLGLAQGWMEKLGREVPELWVDVREKLAGLPVGNGTYMVYEGIEEGFWTDPVYTSNHPALVGLHGWLPPTPGLDIALAKATAEKVWTHWNATDFWGWDFPMLAMSAARSGDAEMAVNWLLSPLFTFDDVGMPGGGVQVPTPYFPGAGALLYAVAMMAAGWDGSTGHAPGFPQEGWRVEVEGVSRAL